MRGFSLIELLVAMAIAGLLAGLALPGYRHALHRAMRQDARLALLQLQHRQERHFASHMRYSSQPSGNSSGAVAQDRSGQGHYLLELQVSADGMSYTALARADPAGPQATDSHCALLAIDETGRRRSADASSYWRDDDPYRCWG